MIIGTKGKQYGHLIKVPDSVTKEDIEEIISQIKSKKLELPLEGLDNHEQLSILEIPHNVTFGLNLPSVKLRKEELDKLMSDLEDAVSEMESDTPKI